jgi:hypothetical protein
MSSSVMFSTNTHILSGRRPRVRVSKTSLNMGRDVPDSLQRETWVRLSLRPSSGDVRPCHRDVCSSIHCHPTQFVTNPALGDQASIVYSRDVGQCVIGGFNAYAGVRPDPPALDRFPTVNHCSCSFPCYLVAIPIFSAILVCFLVAHLLVSGAGYSVFLP